MPFLQRAEHLRIAVYATIQEVADNVLRRALGGAVVELLIPATGSLEGAYSLMWIVMLVPLALAFVVIVRWNIKRR